MEHPDDKSKERSTSSNEDVELLIDKKIAEAKLLVAEKRLHFLLALGAAFLAVFGVVLPLFLTQRSTDRVDKAIERMDAKFSELAGRQLRKPQIACYLGDKPLANAVISFDPLNPSKQIVIKNVGDGTADYVTIRLYVDSKDERLIRDLTYTLFFREHYPSDKPAYETALSYDMDIRFCAPQSSFAVDFDMQQLNLTTEDLYA